MTKEEFNNKIRDELSVTELALINFNIYYSEDHLRYYCNYHMGKYKKCYSYLMKNRHILTLEHTPDKYKELAGKTIFCLANYK